MNYELPHMCLKFVNDNTKGDNYALPKIPFHDYLVFSTLKTSRFV